MATRDTLTPKEAQCSSGADYAALALEALQEPADAAYAGMISREAAKVGDPRVQRGRALRLACEHRFADDLLPRHARQRCPDSAPQAIRMSRDMR